MNEPCASIPVPTRTLTPPPFVAMNDTHGPVSDELLHAGFEARVRIAPARTAVIQGDVALSYAELDALSNRLGRRLRRLGVKPNELVAVVMHKGWEQVVATLAILKAGAAYMPVDASLPIERIRHLIQRGENRFALTQPGVDARLAWPPGLTRLIVTRAACGEEDGATLDSVQGPDDLAYVLFTSGSTGEPKGVMIEHRGAVNTIRDVNSRFGVVPDDRVLALSSLSFDLSVYDVFGLLAVGGAVVMPEANATREPRRWAHLAQEHRVTLWNSVPALMGLLMDYVDDDPSSVPSSLRLVMMSGDWIPLRLVAKLKARLPAAELISLGGATEASIWSNLYPIGEMDPAWTSVPYGRAMLNQRIYVLNESLEPAAVGEQGDVFLAGVGLARGYWRDAVRTDAAFFAHPRNGERLYRTGDLGRYLPDGNTEFLGRADSQVKIQGNRVELGEIEAALLQYPDVNRAVVAAQDAEGGGRYLAAYLVGDPAQPVEPARLREFLAAKLPSYMVPATFMTLPSLPLTSNGKIDRRALPKVAPEATTAAGPGDPPRTPTEEAVAAIWRENLHVPHVGREANFFDLGGQSLQAIHVMMRIQGKLGVEIPVGALFESPTVRALAERIDATAPAAGPSLAHAPRPGPQPLSRAQERLWFVENEMPGTPLYNLPLAFELRGPLDVEALNRAWNVLVERHEALRTTFAVREDEPKQIVHPAAPVALPVVDLEPVPAADREAVLQRSLESDGNEPFDLDRGPLLRAKLYRLEPERHVIFLMPHHIVFDGWSLQVLLSELSALYAARTPGAAALPAPPVTYTDYAAWERAALDEQAIERKLAFWRSHLTAPLPVLNPPSDRPRPAKRSHHGAEVWVRFPAELSRRFAELAAREGCTPFVAMLAAYGTFLYRHTWQTDLIVGCPAANRARPELAGVIGFFVNTLPLRIRIEGGMTFRQLLGQVRQTQSEAFAHQDLPLQRIVESVKPPRNASHTPLFQTILAFEDAPCRPDARLGQARMQERRVSQDAAMADLIAITRVAQDGLMVSLVYSTDLFDRDTVARMLERFRVLLEGVIAAPERRLDDLPLPTEEERGLILGKWSAASSDYPRHRTVTELFEEWAAARPDAVAAVLAGSQGETVGSLTYAALNGRANALAKRLRRLGVGPDVPVGLCAERSLELLVGMVGILKAGGAYVPLDPSYPAERLTYMMQDSGIGVLVVEPRLEDSLPPFPGSLVRLEGNETSDENVAAGTTSEHLVYIIYTSGSTGLPKGVAVPHRGVVRLVCGSNYAIASPDTVMLHFSAISFDASTEEIWAPLLNGGRVVECEERRPSLAELGRVIREQGINDLPLTTEMFRLMVEEQIEDLRGARQIIVGGDIMSVAAARKVLETLPGCRLLNGYGPTENSVCTTFYDVTRGRRLLPTIPIGGPLSNTTVYILDRQFQPVPVGVPGELYTGGDGLARGYWRRPELTAQRFVRNPFSADPNARMYATGDLARWLPDGNVEFLGRADRQVKIRGYRVEPGEIEAALAEIEDVGQNVVILRQDASGSYQLVAYVVPRKGRALDIAALRETLRRRLPEHMVPQHLVELPSLPLTPVGKIDRDRLPAPDRQLAQAPANYVPPRTSAEEALAGIWARLLRLDRVSVRAGFFELGGDSILGIQVIARAAEAGLRLTPRDIFQHQTIEALAQVAQTTRAAAHEQVATTGEVLLTPIQRWFFDQDFADAHHWNQTMLMEVNAATEPKTVERALRQLVAHHDALRLRFRRDGAKGWVQAHAETDVPVRLEMVDLAAHDEQDQDAAIRRKSARLQAGLNLTEGPLLRAAWFKLGARRPPRLLVAIHHLVVDGVSWRVLLEDLETLCRPTTSGQPARLPPKTTSFQAWARKLRDYAQGTTAHEELDYWLRQTIEGDSVPTRDFDRGEPTEATARVVSVELDAPTTQALLQDVPRAYQTQINDVLLTATALALAEWTGSRRAFLNLEGHGREDIASDTDLSRTVGWFTTMFAVCLDLGDASEPGDALKTVKEQVRRIPRHGIGYGALRYLGGNESAAALAQRPMPRVSFNYLGQFDATPAPGAVFRLASAFFGPMCSRRARRPFDVEINALVTEGRLRIDVSYSAKLYRRRTIQRFARGLFARLEEIIRHCTSPDAGGFTPSDFPEADMTQDELDALLSTLDNSDEP